MFFLFVKNSTQALHTWPSYSTGFLSRRLIGVVGARINVRSLYAPLGPIRVRIRNQVLAVVSPGLLGFMLHAAAHFFISDEHNYVSPMVSFKLSTHIYALNCIFCMLNKHHPVPT